MRTFPLGFGWVGEGRGVVCWSGAAAVVESGSGGKAGGHVMFPTRMDSGAICNRNL